MQFSPFPIHALLMGASSGIGLALARRLAAMSNVRSLTLCARRISASADIAALLAAPSAATLHIDDADITDEESLGRLAAGVSRRIPSLHLVINTVGLLHDHVLAPEKTLSQLTMPGMLRSFAVNACGPVLLAKALMPLLRRSDPAIFASLSARVGSIGDNRLGGWYSYRAAKAAQNQLLRTLSVEMRRANANSIVLALHPGTTDTGLSKPFQGNVPEGKLFTPDFAAERLLQVIAARSPADSGGFYAWDGREIPW